MVTDVRKGHVALVALFLTQRKTRDYHIEEEDEVSVSDQVFIYQKENLIPPCKELKGLGLHINLAHMKKYVCGLAS